MKWITLALALSAGISGCNMQVDESERWKSVAKVENFIHSVQSRTGIIISQRQIEKWMCNFARVEIAPGDFYSATALHCIGEQHVKQNADILFSKHLTSVSQLLNESKNASVKIPDGMNIPPSIPLSPLFGESLDKEIISIVGCFPDKSEMWCYTITGEALYNKDNNKIILFIRSEDYNRIYKHNTYSDRIALNGMSGSPVLDSQWRYIGAFTNGTLHNDSLNLGPITTNLGALIITPARSIDGTLTNKL
jgi:hypothetical protein